MQEVSRYQKVKRIIAPMKQWAFFIVLLIVLRYTGILSGISVFTQSALMKTGMMDINPKDNPADKAFDYDFTIRDLEGKEVNMSDFKGKVIFLNLWATWCGPCRSEMPSIQELYNKVDHDKVAFVMLSLDTDQNAPKINRYIEQYSFSFPVYRPGSPVPNQLRVSTIPTTFVVGPDGRIKMKKTGAANYATEEFKEFLLKQTVSEQK
jgi:thiol-disulfide isomerase/thioredoxin